ncbi:hypothetical protein LTS08_001651 [Lithohypha guttulata]|nr:hypothetical protein LTS08_001651 [Lithohypha guttulata]
MSTFDGIVDEFPNIRIDYFRQHGKVPPAACFLSHVHSDHLLGLETLRMPFVYCSAATHRILLKMEKYPHRINFSKGILEARKQTYKHLKQILRPLPLNTPIELELGPKSRIRVTLFDANHCPGAVMFLIEGEGRAVLYTGDVRAEPWWVNATIARNPVLIPYTIGQKTLDCIYLDTTFASHQDTHREFPTKSEGLRELVKKMKEAPSDSTFYFRAWTLGYEDVWITLSSLLQSHVHVDEYQFRLFRGVAEDGLDAQPGPALTGFKDSQLRARHAVSHSPQKESKHNLDGTELAEIGAGGGKGDLYLQREVELSNINGFMLESLRKLCRNASNTEAVDRLESAIDNAQDNHVPRFVIEGHAIDPAKELTIQDFLSLANKQPALTEQEKLPTTTSNVIHFPYSRHSSYSELRHLVGTLRPKDICPCTIDLKIWSEEVSMQSLFGDLCSGQEFRYDKSIREEVERRAESSETQSQNQTQRDTQQSESQVLEGGEQYKDCSSETASPRVVRTSNKPPMHIAGDAHTKDNPRADPPQQPPQTPDTTLPDNRTPRERLEHAWRTLKHTADHHNDKTSEEPSQEVFTNDTPEPNASQAKSDAEVEKSSPEHTTAMPADDVQSQVAEEGNLEQQSEAYEAARICLETGDDADWQDLCIVSLRGRKRVLEEQEI